MVYPLGGCDDRSCDGFQMPAHLGGAARIGAGWKACRDEFAREGVNGLRALSGVCG